MNVLTIKSAEEIPADLQTDIHYTFRMEHHTDYILKDRRSSAYSATISIDGTAGVIDVIVRNSSAFPELNFVIDDLDMEEGTLERYFVRNGKITGRKSGSLMWKE